MHVTTRAPDAEAYSVQRYLDIELAATVALGSIASAMAAARRMPPGPWVKGVLDAVALLPGGILRVEWSTTASQLTPSIDRAVARFPGAAAPALEVEFGFSSRDPAHRDSLVRRLGEMAREGSMHPERIARLDMGLSAEDARELVRCARKGERAGAS